MRGVGIFLFVSVLMAGLTGCPPGPIEIRDWHELHAVRDDLEEDYVLVNDLDAATPGYAELAGPSANGGRGWEPIGTTDAGFTGSFNGQGYEIRDLHINRPDEDYVGLFSRISWIRHIENFGVIENVGVIDADVTGKAKVGALVGHNGGIVRNSYSGGTVTGSERVGGLVGWNQHTLRNSYSSCTVTGDSAVGGLVGDNWTRSTISDSYATGSVSGSSKVGGLVGWNYHAYVHRSYSTGALSGEDRVGGLIGGRMEGIVSDSFWNAESSGMAISDGGAGKTTADMRSMATFVDTTTTGLDEPWRMTSVSPGETDPAYAWNIVDGQTYPFLSWQEVG
ncbi:MAG: hypothetical protein IBX67_00745 [Dehalococcoidia bacterium]|nr:hypothetical protein [Dehalococcoidia bacterium]